MLKTKFYFGPKEFWRRYWKNRAAVAGLIFILFFLTIAIFADFISPYQPLDTRAGTIFQEPCVQYFFGTDDLGRDILSGVIHGSRISLVVGFSAAAASTLIGIIIGAIAGYFGGTIDDVLMRITDAFLVIPMFVLALLVVAFFGSNVVNVIFAITILSWPQSARVIRAEFLSMKNREYVQAARATGSSNLYVIFSEILPNAIPPAVVVGTMQVATAILIEAGLSFLGFGDPNNISWGQMLHQAQPFLRTSSWMAIFPGIAISLTTLGFNLIGDGLNDVFNPRLKER